jgi:hypothetical protein
MIGIALALSIYLITVVATGTHPQLANGLSQVGCNMAGFFYQSDVTHLSSLIAYIVFHHHLSMIAS